MVRKDEVLLPMLIKRASRMVDAHVDQLLKEHSIARSQYRVLYYVNYSGELSQKDLIKNLNVQGSTLTLIVDALVQKGWIVRESDTADRRTKILRLTKKGQQLFNQIPDPLSGLNKKLADNLGAHKVQDLEKMLGRVIELLN